MIVTIDEREMVRDGFNAMFDREGVPASGIDPAQFADWIGAVDAVDLEGIEMFLVGEGAAPDALATLRERSLAPVIAIVDGRSLDKTLERFSVGCDDVVRKPVHARELLARAAAIRCRRRGETDRAFRLGRLVVHADGRDPEIDGEPMALPRRERRVLEVLAAARGRVVSKPQLFSAVYGAFRTDIEECVVESHVSKLRKKLRARLGSDPVTSRRFLGYAIAAAEDQQSRARAAA